MAAPPDGFAGLDEAADAIAAYNPNRRAPAASTGCARTCACGEDGRWRWHGTRPSCAIGDEPQRLVDRHRLEAAARALAIPDR